MLRASYSRILPDDASRSRKEFLLRSMWSSLIGSREPLHVSEVRGLTQHAQDEVIHTDAVLRLLNFFVDAAPWCHIGNQGDNLFFKGTELLIPFLRVIHISTPFTKTSTSFYSAKCSIFHDSPRRVARLEFSPRKVARLAFSPRRVTRLAF